MAENENAKKKGQLNVNLNEEVAEGVYANLAAITHSSAEFVLDFIRVMPGMPKAEVKSRIILTPEHAKRFMRALQDNVDKYEQMHGTIKSKDDGGGNLPPMSFGGPTAQA